MVARQQSGCCLAACHNSRLIADLAHFSHCISMKYDLSKPTQAHGTIEIFMYPVSHTFLDETRWSTNQMGETENHRFPGVATDCTVIRMQLI